LKEQDNRENILKYKLIYTALILGVYMLGRGIPLYMIDTAAYLHKTIDTEAVLIQTISGDIYRCSLFALGISPYMISNLLVQVIVSLRSQESRAKISQARMNRLSMKLMLTLAVAQAIVGVQGLHFRVTGEMLVLAKVVAAIEMVAGAMIIIYLSERNKKYGIGGQSALIFVNIIDGLISTLQGHSIREMAIPLLISLVVMGVVMFMENTEHRIPVQRISIHNIYADKNYFAIKLNPIGVMPAMFSMAFFMLPQLVVTILTWIFPGNASVLWWQNNLSLSKPFGIGIYILVLYILTIGFSRVFVNPREITEQFLKSGDSIQNLHAGRDTKRYLSRVITGIGMLSATVMSVCLGVPMILQLTGGMESGFTSLPSSVMMMTGIWCNLYSEVRAIRDLEAYEPFI